MHRYDIGLITVDARQSAEIHLPECNTAFILAHLMNQHLRLSPEAQLRNRPRPMPKRASAVATTDTRFGTHGGRSPMSAVARREHSCGLIDQKSSHVAQYASTGWPSLSTFSNSPRMYPTWGRWCLHFGHVARKGIASSMRASAFAVSVSGT